MLRLHLKKLFGLVMTVSLAISLFAGCGSIKNDEIIGTVDNFLSAAQEADLDTAGNYATDEVIEQLGWSDDDIKEFLSDIFAAIAGYGVSEEDLMAIPEVEAAVNVFSDKLKDSFVTSYIVDSASVSKTAAGYEVKASVATVSEEDFYGLLDDELITEVSEFSSKYASEHAQDAADDPEDEMYTNLYKALVPFLMNKMTASLDDLAGSDESTWIFTLDKEGGKLLIIGVESTD